VKGRGRTSICARGGGEGTGEMRRVVKRVGESGWGVVLAVKGRAKKPGVVEQYGIIGAYKCWA